MRVGERIKVWREARGYSQTDLADVVRVGQTTVSSWEKGRTEPKRAMVAAIASALGVSIGDIEGTNEDGPPRQRFAEVPVISWVSAGQLQDPGQVSAVAARYAERILVPDLPPGRDYFATDVRGDSMDRISPEGSRIIVDATNREPRSGRCYIFSLRGEATYKRYQDDPIRLEPFSTNPNHRTIFPKADRDWLVIGRVVRSYIDLE